MASCKGKRTASKSSCGLAVYRCTKCGCEGCGRMEKNECTNQAFLGTKCLKCGAMGKREPVK